MKYQEVPEITKEEAEKIFQSNDHNLMSEALVSAAYYIDDWKWVEAKCLLFLENEDIALKIIAITCLSHLVRIHQKVSKDLVDQALLKYKKDKLLKGEIKMYEDDVQIFLN